MIDNVQYHSVYRLYDDHVKFSAYYLLEDF